jgi:Bacterial membrane protein YfhO
MLQDTERRAGNLMVSICLITAVWGGAASRWIINGAVVPWDSKNQFYAFFRFLSASLHATDWPFWNPYHYGGHPSVADPQSLVFAPLFVAWGALDPAPSMRAFDIVILAHLLVGGIAIVVIGCRARWPVPSCVLAAILFMFGGAASGRLQHTGIILSYSLFPLALLLLQLALERSSYILAIGFAGAAAGVALGQNQVALLLCTLLLAAAVAEVLCSPHPARYLRERSGVLATIAVGGGALLVVPVLLTLQFANLSNRPTESLKDALRASLYPANLATLAIPNVFGTHAKYWGPGPATLPEVALTDDAENYLFFGAVPTLLIVWVGVAGGSTWRPGRRLMTGTVVIAVLFMLGRYTPLYELAFKYLPGIDLFRRPTDASFVFGIAFALLAGHCLADYVREGLPPFRLLYTVSAVTPLVFIVASALAFSTRTGHGLDAAREAVVSAAVMLITGLILFGARQGPARLTAATLVTLITAAELLWWNAASQLNARSWSNYAVLETPTASEAAAIGFLDETIAADHRRGDYPRVEVLGLGGPWQNLAMVRGWEATNGYNPLRIGIYDRLVSPGEQSWDVYLRQFPPSFESYSCALAQTLGLTYLVLGQPLSGSPIPTPTEADLIFAGPPAWIYRLPGALPRAQFSDGSGNVKVESSRPGRVELMVSSTTGGLLMLHDTYYPGWIARVDGLTVPIRRADTLFRAVELPPGAHRVTFQFVPFSLLNLRNALNVAVGFSQRVFH